MAPRRGAPSSNSLSPQDPSSPNGQSPAFLGFPRSTSPSNGFTQLLSRPSKWFGRSTSNPKISSVVAATEPRASSSSGRKHKISRPTDPRPILDSYASAPGARSVLDLAHKPSLDFTLPFTAPSQPSSPVTSHSPGGLGDLRTISRRAWSKSADDLGRVSTSNSPSDGEMMDKITQYRNRSNSNGSLLSSTPTTPPPSLPHTQQHPSGLGQGVQPFPTIARTVTPPSSTRPNAPTVSISISAPVVDEATAKASTPQQAHTRSHSFTPKLTSKLSAPRFIPPSPKRKGSGGSEIEGNSNTSPRATGFPFGSSSKTLVTDLSSNQGHAPRSTTLLAPPAILEPGSDECGGSQPKRSSQIVYNSGFINKFADSATNLNHAQLGSTKAWKPYKLELKGSKLYFYKPPSDRASAVKDLFPTQLVPAAQQDEDDNLAGGDDIEDDPFAAGKARLDVRSRREDSSIALRKKRAFWGRGTHPDLVRDGEGRIEKATFEALTHEAVFGTTFLVDEHGLDSKGTEVEDGQVKKRNCLEDWKDFAASVLLCLPYLVDQSKFETEFMRCCDNLIGGIEEDKKLSARQRVAWLAGEYLGYHGKPHKLADWEKWRVDVLPDTASAVVPPTPEPSLPMSASTQALFNPTPVNSPHTNMFSPRPEENTEQSLMDALGGRDLPSSSSSKLRYNVKADHRQHQSPTSTPLSSSGNSNVPWASALDREGLSRHVLLLLDPHLIARSLNMFHSNVLHQIPDNLTADFVLKPDLPVSDPSASGSSSHHSFSSLFGSDEHPHWLTKFLLVQILGADTSTGYTTFQNSQLSSPGRKSDDRSVHTSRTHSRSEVISVWVKIGELCRLNGDECSWQAILQAICSVPVARLEKVWKRVDPAAVATVESWAQLGGDGEAVGIKEPRMTPWGGNVRDTVRQELSKASEESEDILHVASLEKARLLFEGFRQSFSLCPRKGALSVEAGDDVRKLVSYWWDILADGGGAGSLSAKFQRIDQFMSLSLAAEPRRKGLYEPFYWSKAPTNYPPTAPLIPLLFPEPLPTISLLDRSQLLRGRVDSDATDIQQLRAVDGHLRPDDRKTSKFTPEVGGGTFIPVFGGDVLVVVQNPAVESTPNSRPSSLVRSRPPSTVIDPATVEKPLGRTPSIRVKPGSSPNIERKASLARRNSLPALSQRQPLIVSETSSEPPLRVLIQAGTLDRLVEVLVHGLHNVSVSVADDNGEMSLREGMTRELLLDHKEFIRVWWNVFRSFVTPLIFFELLRKIYIKSQPSGSPPPTQEYRLVIASRLQVLETIRTWVIRGGGAQDILDDVQLHQALQGFFQSSTDHLIHTSPNFDDEGVRQAWESLIETRQSLERQLHSQLMRPPPTRTQPFSRHALTTTESRVRNLSTREPPDIDRLTPEELVDNLDGMAFAAFNNVTEEDLYVASDLLEVQSADKTGWFLPREPPTSEELVEIQTIYSHVQDVEPSSLISEIPESLYRVLPPGIRSCIRAHTILRKWIISKIVAPRLGLRARQSRIEFLLRALELARLRSTESPTPESTVSQPCVRSFVEAVITSAILSVESRMHYRAWQNVALSRGCQYDTLSALMSRPSVQSVSSKEPLTVDMGWLIERLLDVIAMPDLVGQGIEEGQNLVNFDKRRNLCNFISNAPSLLSRRLVQQNDINRRGFERLNNIEREVFSLQFDPRGIRDEAYRENMSASATGTPSRKVVRPFQRLVMVQIEKNRRDKNLRGRLQKERLQEQSRNEKREEQLNRAMRGGRRPPSVLQKQHRNKKSMSALFSFMRPISSAFGAETPSHPPALKRTASELDFIPTAKPSLVLSLTDARVAQFINNDRSFTFRLDTEDGGHYLLQAMAKRDMNKWMETLARISKTAAKRRLTYLGNSPQAQVADHLHNGPTAASRDPVAVFGVELEFLLEREAEGKPILPGTVPSVIDRCLAEVESRGLTEVGIYRMAGANSEIAALKDALNQGRFPVERTTDIHAVCDLVKSWFRVLPEPLFPPSSYHDVIDTIKLENLEERIAKIRNIVQNLPQANFDLLRRISEHLDKVTDFEEQNQMTAEALSIVFSPNLLRAPQNDFLTIIANMPHAHKLVKTLITYFHVIFDESDPEAEVDQEDELDTPIAEEDEEDEGDFSQPFIEAPEPLQLNLDSAPLNTFTIA